MSRSGRFSKFCLDTDARSVECLTLWKDFQPLLQSYEKHPAILIGQYLQLITRYRKKNLWKGNHFAWFSPNANEQHLDFLQFWSNNTLRGIPHKINRVLINWRLGYYPLVLINHVPTAKEMLELQSQGKRFVTLFTSQKDWRENTLHGRDHFSFTVHDLIHAYEFFHNDEMKNKQILFYQKLLKHYEKLITLCQHPDYIGSLFYLISDMNTHTEHMEVYFQGLLKRFNITPYNLNL